MQNPSLFSYQNVPPSMSIRSCICCKPKPGVTLLQPMPGDVQVRVNKKNALELTKMEWQVIREVGCGLSNKEIAGRLYLSEGTVRNYISSILRKLELRDRTQLAIWAVQNQNSQPEADV